MMLITKLNSKLMINLNFVKLNKHVLERQLIDKKLINVVRRTSSSSISITLKEDDLPVIRTKYEKLYGNKYFKNKDKDEFKTKLIDYFHEVGIDYNKMISKVNSLDLPSIRACRFYAHNFNNELVQIKKLILNLFTHSINQVYGGEMVDKQLLNSQLMIAELIQLLHIVHQVHGNLVHLEEFELKSLHDGNKLAILSGDFLFAIVMKLLAKIGNNDVTISITDAVNNLNYGQFTLSASDEELLDNMNINKWLEIMDLVYAFSFRKGCESIVELINVPSKIKQLAGEFGHNFALALQASTELDQLKKFLNLNSQKYSNFNDLNNSPLNSENDSTHPILNLSSTHIDLFQLPLILDCDNLPSLIRKVKNLPRSSSLKPLVSYELLRDHLDKNSLSTSNLKFSKTTQFIDLYANKSVDCLEKLFSQTNLETNDLLKDFVYTVLYLNKLDLK